MTARTIFYSWQSDLPNQTNRGFIEDCLGRSLQKLSQAADSLGIDPSLDRDTQNTPGTPDIAATIYEKIDGAAAFVADVSLIHPLPDPAGGAVPPPRRTPNPNVLIELGYAARSLGWDSIVVVFNETTGLIAELPFDIRQRRVMRYRLQPGDERSDERARLAASLTTALREILQRPSREETRERHGFFTSLTELLTDVLILSEEANDRQLNPWSTKLRETYGAAAGQVREMAVTTCARREGLELELTRLAESLDVVAHHRPSFQTAAALPIAIKAAADQARELMTSRVDAVSPATQLSRAAFFDRADEFSREIAGLVQRWTPLSEQGRLEPLLEEASALGHRLLILTYRGGDRVVPGLVGDLRRIGRLLHLAETFQFRGDAGFSERNLLWEIAQGSFELSELLGRL